MNMNNLPVGTIIMSNNTRLIVIGYNQNGYLVCPCSEKSVDTKTIYMLLSNQIEKVLSLGYVDNVVESGVKAPDPFNNNVVPTTVSNTSTIGSGKYIFDENGFIIGEQ